MVERISMADALARGFDKGSKFKNIKTVYDGREYHSQKEANYAADLDRLKKAADKKDRVISWEPQVEFKIVINGHKICSYFLDFLVKYGDGRTEYIDVKSEFTRSDKTYRIKKKLMLAVHQIDIKEAL